MRLAYVQLGAGFPPLDDQVRRLMPLYPDDYAIEENPTIAALRRICGRLDALGPGDRLCVATLDAFCGTAREMMAVFLDLFKRGVVVESFDEYGEIFELGGSREALRLLDWLVARPESPAASSPRRGGAVAPLSSGDIAEIHRLAASGLTARRIGLIFRRSPKSIEDVLRLRTETQTPQVTQSAIRYGRCKFKLHKTVTKRD